VADAARWLVANAPFQIPRHEASGHGGNIPGFGAALWHAPGRDVTVAFVRSDQRLDPTLVVQPLLDAVREHLER
jgi:hypothetical protein